MFYMDGYNRRSHQLGQTKRRLQRAVWKRGKRASATYKFNANGRQNKIFSNKTPNLRVTRWNQSGSNFNPRTASFSPVPQEFYTKLAYSESVVLASTIGGLSGAGYIFSLNDLYDPNKTGGGHQPLGFDQLTPLYNRYKVYKTEIAIQFCQPSTAGARSYGAYQILNPSNYGVSTAGLKVEDFQERPRADAIRVMDSDEPSVVSFTVKLPEVIGAAKMTDSQFGDNYSGSDVGDPGNQIAIALHSVNETGTDLVSIACRVKIVYHVWFYNPKMLNQS